MSTASISVDGLSINGTAARKNHAALAEAITSGTLTETITGASTVELTVNDPKRTLLRSGLLAERTTLVVDQAGFELVAVSKSGDSGLKLTFEDLAVAALRRHKSALKAAAGTTSRVGFVERMAREEAWIKVQAQPGPKTLVEVTRGTGLDTEEPEEESSWDAASRIMGEIAWRTFARRGELWVASDKWLLDRVAPISVTEDTPGVDGNIGFTYDVGQPAAKANFTCRTGSLRSLLPGLPVLLQHMGPADGRWLIETITRTFGSGNVAVDLIRPQPTLPEPEDTSSDGTGDGGIEGFQADLLAGEYDPAQTGTGSSSDIMDRFVKVAQSKIGKPYVWGASGPNSFDCSGLVYWAAKQVGVSAPKPAQSQFDLCREKGAVISVQQAINTRGALLFRLDSGATNHVAISTGNGTTMEAMGRAYGCRTGSTKGRFDHGGLLPGLGATRSTAARGQLMR